MARLLRNDGEDGCSVDKASHVNGESSLAGPASARSTKATASNTKAGKSHVAVRKNCVLLTMVLALVVFNFKNSLTVVFNLKNSLPVGVLQLSSSSETDFDLTQQMNEATPRTASERVVFCNIFMGEGPQKTALALSIVREQLTRKSAPGQAITSAPIHYTLISQNQSESAKVQQICDDLQQDCRLSGYHETGGEGLTLQALHDHCNDHPEDLVTYIHDKGSFHDTLQNVNLRRMLTQAAFSNECQVNMTELGCNFCSARFSPLPHAHNPGNMWTAKCDYVKKLLRPDGFAAAMQAMVDHLVEAHEVDPSIPGTGHIGLGRYAMEHWLGSHPSMQACDIYPGVYEWNYGHLPDSETPWVPDLKTAPRVPFSETKLSLPFLQNHRHKEWFCGPRRLLEYGFLYNNELPPPQSYIWTMYDEGNRICPVPINPSYA